MTDRDDGAEDSGILAALHERSLRFSEAIDRLDAEVASHESGKVELVIENLTGEEVEYAVLGPPLGDFPDPDLAPHFGARLRGAISRNGVLRGWGFLAGISLTEKQVAELDRIADAIDQDANRQAMEAAEAYIGDSRHIRQQIEQLVEELRYSMEGLKDGREHHWDVLDVEPLLERLDLIFGERREAQSGHFAFGVVGPDGPFIDEVCVFGEIEDARTEADSLNDDGAGYEAVELLWRRIALTDGVHPRSEYDPAPHRRETSEP